MTAAQPWRLSRPVRRVVARFAQIACPPEIRAGQRVDRTLAEFELMLGALQPAARYALAAAFLAFDRGARLYPRSRRRRFTRLPDGAADAYLRALLARQDILADVTRKLKSAVVICYYALPDVQQEIGYLPGPYIAAMTRRRLASYGDEIRRAEVDR
ncbi:MAG TPA: hypothetical protein VKS82_07220 [Streptosporangiaceae bacterium]|nr:hypothetical protein [Streptosporangiaceae bacterium]